MVSSKVRPRYMSTSAVVGQPPTYKWIFKVDLNTFRTFTLAQSTTHTLELLHRTDKAARFVLPQSERPDQDFHFLYSCEGMTSPKYVASEDGRHGLLSFIPNFCSL
jgi:hypothetical protein